MKERLKTLLLISLVGISLWFTQKSWIEMPNRFFDVFESEKAYSSTYLLSDMLAPNKYILNFNEKYHTVINNDYEKGLLAYAKDLITKGFSNKLIEISSVDEKEYHNYFNRRSIVFYFPEKVNTRLLTKILEIESPNEVMDNLSDIDNVYIFLASGDPFFIFSDGEDHFRVSVENLDTGKLKEKFKKIEADKNYNYYDSMANRFAIDNNIFIPYEMNNPIPRVFVENKIVSFTEDEKKELVETFFDKDIDYIREIVEKNGSTIYVYNQKVLKLDINGTLEYFNSLENKVRKRNLYESMNTATNFLSQNTDLILNMYLDEIEEIEIDNSLGYRFTFGYRVGGIPVILGNQEVDDFIEMEVFNGEVRLYKHHIRRYMNRKSEDIKLEKKILSSFQVIDMNDQYIIEAYLRENKVNTKDEEDIIEEVLSSIQSIDLAYFDPSIKTIGEELIPVWVIESEKAFFAFNVYNGELIYQQTY